MGEQVSGVPTADAWPTRFETTSAAGVFLDLYDLGVGGGGHPHAPR